MPSDVAGILAASDISIAAPLLRDAAAGPRSAAAVWQPSPGAALWSAIGERSSYFGYLTHHAFFLICHALL